MMLTNKPFSLTLKVTGIAATAALSSFVVAPKADAVILSTQTQTTSFTNALTELTGTPVLTLNQYSGGGTLTSVIFNVTATLTSSGTVTNTAAQPQTFTVTLVPSRFNLDVQPGAPAALLNLANPTTGATFSPFADSHVSTIGSQTYPLLQSNTPAAFGPFGSSGSSNATFTAPGDLAGFYGNGSFSFDPFTTISTAIAGGGGNVNTNITTVTGASVTVTYNGIISNQVPEPTTVLGSIVALGLGVAIRKMKTQPSV